MDSLREHTGNTEKYAKEMDGYYTDGVPQEELQTHYERFSRIATTIDDELKEANRRKPKKAKTDKPAVKAESS